MSIKDLLLTRGWPTLRGSHTIDPAGPWDLDAPAVARVREHGGVIVGKTTTPELGWKGVTDSPLTGVTRNPWNPARTSGGSSGGSAAAVALGMAPLSLGTDGGGSVRIPAGFCGVTTIKPTWGRVPLYPASPFGALSHVGPMTRTAADAALLLDVVSGADARDPWALAPAPPTVAELARPVSRAAGGGQPDAGLRRRRPGGRRGVRVRRRGDRDAGGQGRGGRPGLRRPDRGVRDAVVRGGRDVAGSARARAERAKMDPGLVDVAEQGARTSAVDYLQRWPCATSWAS